MCVGICPAERHQVVVQDDEHVGPALVGLRVRPVDDHAAVAVEARLEVLHRLEWRTGDDGSSLTLYQAAGETMSPPDVCAVTTYPPVVAVVTYRTAVPGRSVVVVPLGAYAVTV